MSPESDAPGSEQHVPDAGGPAVAGAVDSESSAPRRRFRRRAHTRRKRSWRRRLLITVLSIVVLLALIVAAGLGYVAYRNGQIKRIHVSHLAAPAKSGPEVGTQTFLLIGSTSRCALKKQNAAFGLCSEGVNGVNSDVIILLRADAKTHSISVLSIPRDTVLYGVRPVDQFYKIDAALADGPGQLVNVIEQDYGIPINHFVDLNFDSFMSVVNAIGGIDMYFPYPEYDDYSSLDIKTAGCHHLNGFEALAVVRARHLSYYVDGQWEYDGTGDLGRILRVHEFLKVLAATMERRGLDNPLTDNSILGAIAPQLTVDSKLSLSDMVHLVLAFHSFNPSSAPMATMPNVEDFEDYMFEGYDFGSVVLPTYPQDQEAIDKFEGLAKPPGSSISPKRISVSVVNGTSQAGDETEVASKLSSLGYHVVSTSTATPVGPLSETVVYYRAGHLLDAERVVQSLHGIVSMALGPTQDGAEVSVVTGSNASVIVPTPGHSSHQHHTAAASSATSDEDLGAPSAAIQQLPAWDPRACSNS